MRAGLVVAGLAAAGLAAAVAGSYGDEPAPRSTTTTADRPTSTAEPTPTTDVTTTTDATSTTSPSTTSTTLALVTELDWKDCDGGFQCATLEVPVDHRDLAGDTIELGLARRPARVPAARIGSLLMNPGGPGGSAVELIESTPLPSTLTDRFDIVGFDPRGVGRSAALDCRTHLQAIYDDDPTIDDAADRRRLLADSKAFVDECRDRHQDLLPYLGTTAVARDMERVRIALGEEQVNYVGYSYGTALGQEYARLYPGRVRTMVLDGVVDLSKSGIEAAASQASGFTRALAAFTAACDRRDCGLGDPAGEVVDEVIASAERRPIPARGADRPAGPGVVNLALAQALYSETLWPQLGRALEDARDGQGAGLVGLADAYLRRDPDGTYSFAFEAYFAVSCLDQAFPRDPQAVLDAAKYIGASYPQVGEGLVNDYVRCALWPVPPDPLAPMPPATKGLPPVVVISTTGDPATPYENGVTVAHQIPGARLVTNVGEGHTVFAQGKGCIDDAVTTYLVHVKPPAAGLVCD